MNIAALVDLADVARDEKAVVPKLRFSLLGHVPIALEHIGPAHLDATNFLLCKHSARFRFGDANLDTWQRNADGARNAIAVIRIRSVHIGFGHAVALENRVARTL